MNVKEIKDAYGISKVTLEKLEDFGVVTHMEGHHKD